MERQRLAEEEGRKSRDWMGTLGKVALGAGAGYLTGGLANALLPATLGGTGAGIGATLTPTAANVLPAMATGAELLKSPDKDALAAGIEKGVEKPILGMEKQAEAQLAKRLGYIPYETKIGGTTAKNPAVLIAKKTSSKSTKGMTEAQAKGAVDRIYKNTTDPSVQTWIEDNRGSNTNLTIYNELKRQGYE